MSNRYLKLVRSLRQKKYRQEHGLFIVEGIKNVNCLLASGCPVRIVFHTEGWHPEVKPADGRAAIHRVSRQWMEQASLLETPSPVLALAVIPEQPPFRFASSQSVFPVFTGLNDPGNLGTIIRLCDWFGLNNVIVSPDTADTFNPKTVQAAMGALFHVRIFRMDVMKLLEKNRTEKKLPVLAADMKGKNVKGLPAPVQSIVIFGSEAHGIPDELKPHISDYIHIPASGQPLTESLNVSIAAGIILHHFSGT